MLAIEVELLTGTYTATHFNDRTQPEWPPHPARLYSAMVAAWADADEPDATEADALRWFEDAGNPAITCSVLTDDVTTNQVAVRSMTTHFVPVNDPTVVRDLGNAYRGLVETEAELVAAQASGEARAIALATSARDKARAKATADSVKAATSGEAPTAALALLPDDRNKQGRSFPTVRPADPVTTLTWPEADPDAATRTTLDALLSRVGRLGHSSSLVSCRIVEPAPVPTMVPVPDGPTQVRLPGRGQLDRLQELFEAHRGEQPRTLPSRMVRYAEAEAARPDVPRSTLGGLFHAATIEPWAPRGDQRPTVDHRLSIRSSLLVARAVRDAVLSSAGHGGADVPELISGHRPRVAGQTKTPPSTRPHMAVVPLPFVGHDHADGLIKGVAVVLPRDVDPDDLLAVDAALGRWLRAGGDPAEGRANLWGRGLGPDRKWVVAPVPSEGVPITLRKSRWSTASATWATVTPIVLDRYPDGLWRGSAAKRARAEAQAAESITASCRHIGLPEPVYVEIRTDPPVRGAAPLRRYEPFRNGPDDAPRPAVHAVIEFGQKVIGPVILGRGRYLGQGLCVPLREATDG
jgi:CRISPR-associated protein Csb2